MDTGPASGANTGRTCSWMDRSFLNMYPTSATSTITLFSCLLDNTANILTLFYCRLNDTVNPSTTSSAMAFAADNILQFVLLATSKCLSDILFYQKNSLFAILSDVAFATWATTT